MAVTLFCIRCKQGRRFQNEVGHTVCPICRKPSIWVSSFEVDPPEVPYKLSRNDREFLKSVRIAGDTDPVTS